MKVQINKYITLNVFDSGEGGEPTLVFIHGLLESIDSWQYQINYFSKKHRIMAYDLRGCGQSSRCLLANHNIDSHVADLRTLITKLNISQPILVSHSYSSLIAIKYALNYETAGLALISGTSRSLNYMRLFWLELPFLFTFLWREFSSKRFLYLFHDLLIVHKFVLWREDLRRNLAKIKCPIVTLSGTRDLILSPGYTKELIKFSPSQAKNVLFKKAGHLLQNGQVQLADEVNRMIDDFIASKIPHPESTKKW